MANTLKIIKDGVKFLHIHNGILATQFSISSFEVTIDGLEFRIVQNDGATRFTYLIPNIIISVGGNEFNYNDPLDFEEKLRAIGYTPYLNSGGGSEFFIQNNKNQYVNISTPLDLNTIQDVCDAINLIAIPVSEFQTLKFKVNRQKTLSGTVIPYIDIYDTNNLGKGNYGLGGIMINPIDLVLTYSNSVDAESVINNPNNEVIYITTLGSQTIAEYISDINPPIVISGNNQTVFVVQDANDNYLWIGMSGTYGFGESTAIDSDFVEIPATPITPNNYVNRFYNGLIDCYEPIDGVFTAFQWVNAPVNTIATLDRKVYSPDFISAEFTTIEANPRKWVANRYNGTTWTPWVEQQTTLIPNSNFLDFISSGQTQLDGKIPLTQKAVANGVATLGSDGKIPNNQLPALAITETFVKNSQSGMLALSLAETGDLCVRTDINKTFILTQSPASNLSNWQEILSPTDAVTSVDGQVGTVNLSTVYEPKFSKNTAFNKNFGTTAGTVVEGNDSRVLNGQTAFGWGNHSSAGYANDSSVIHKAGDETITGNKLVEIGKGFNFFTSRYGIGTPDAAGLQIYSADYDAIRFGIRDSSNVFTEKARLINGNFGINTINPTEKLDVAGNGRFTGTVEIANATADNQAVTLQQLNAAITGIDIDTDWIDISATLPASYSEVVLRYKIKNNTYILDFYATCDGSGTASTANHVIYASLPKVDSEKARFINLENFFEVISGGGNGLFNMRIKSDGNPGTAVSLICGLKDSQTGTSRFRAVLPIVDFN